MIDDMIHALRWEGEGSDAVALPPPQPGHAIWDVIARRRSIRSYTARPVERSQLAAILDAMVGSAEMLRFRVVVRRAEDVPPGVYAVDVGAPRLLTRLREAPRGPMWLQSEFEEASVVVVVLGDLRAADDGEASYVRQLRIGGAALVRGHLASVAQDLGACIFAGILPSAREALGIDGDRRSPIGALALGWPDATSVEGEDR